MIRRSMVIAASALVLLSAVVLASPFELYRGRHLAALFSNGTDETFAGLWVSFSGDVELIQAFGIGAAMTLTSRDAGEFLFEGIAAPFTVWEIDWALGGPAISAAAWIRSDGTRQPINVHAPTARIDLSFVPFLRAAGIAFGCPAFAPLQVRFLAAGSMDPDGDDLAYAWSWSDGLAAQGESVSRRFSKPGRYLVTLTVTDPDGNADTVSRWLEIPSTSCLSCCGSG